MVGTISSCWSDKYLSILKWSTTSEGPYIETIVLPSTNICTIYIFVSQLSYFFFSIFMFFLTGPFIFSPAVLSTFLIFSVFIFLLFF